MTMKRQHLLPRIAFTFALVLATAGAGPLAAGTCTVPGSHSDVQSAVVDANCSTIDLAAQTFTGTVVISRSLALSGDAGGGTVLEGQVWVRGEGVEVDARSLRVESGCPGDALASTDGAQLEAGDVEVVRSAAYPCPPLFADGFESGDTGAWGGS